MKTLLLYLIIILVVCRCENFEHNSKTSRKLQPSYSAPFTVLLDTAPSPKRFELKKIPQPRFIQIPKTDGGFYFASLGSDEEKIELSSPTITKAQLPLANFTNFTAEQGLVASVIRSGLMDKNGRLWFSTSSGVCRYEGTSFINFTIGQGSPVKSIFEDKKGNLWFGTQGGGVSRYDGISFTTLTIKDGLADNFVNSITEDKSGNLWFGTQGGGASRYDGTGFTTFNTGNGLASNNINSITKDKIGNLWFGTDGGGVSRYDGINFKTFTTEQGLAQNTVNNITGDAKGNLWFATRGGGVSRYDGANFITLTTEQGLAHNNVISIAEDRNGKLWFGTQGGGISSYDGATFITITTEHGLSNNIVTSITEDKNGSLWLGTQGGGVSRYNGPGFTTFTTRQGLSNNLIWDIKQDKSGKLWFCTNGNGVASFDGRNFVNFSMKQGLADNTVFCIEEAKNGIKWIGTARGVSSFNGTSFTTYTTQQGLAHNKVFTIMEDKTGNVWFGTQGGGLSRYNGTEFSTFTTEQGLANNTVTSAIEDQNGKLWFGTEGGGVSCYDGTRFTTFKIEQGLAHNIVRSIIVDKSGILWFGTIGGGVSRYDGSGFTTYNISDGLSNNIVYDIVEDENGVIWFGTDEGFCGLKFNTVAQGDKSRKSIGAGLLGIKNEQLKSYTPVWEVYNNKTGYPVKDLNDGAMFITKRKMPYGNNDDVGVIWGGCGDDRVIRFDPKAVHKKTEPPTVFIKSVKIDETDINWYSLNKVKNDSAIIAQHEAMVYGKLLSEWERDSLQTKFGSIHFTNITPNYSVPENLVLPHQNNRVRFDYGSVETFMNSMIRYKYILEGYDNEWSPVTERSSVAYGNIREGAYTFKLIAKSHEGEWSQPLSYKFKVLPPWWRSWWAYCVYGICFIVLIFLVDSFQRKRVLYKERERSRKRELEQARQIEKAYHTLKETQAQLIQSEKMASLGELTAGIAHEIQNPLNFVNNFSEVSNELISEMVDEANKGNTKEVKAIAIDVKQNLEKILYHGKRADAIVKGMLQHSRSSTGVKEPTDINALAEEYLRLAYHGLRAKDKSFNATLKTDFDETIGNINIIPQDIGRVILNLITNAFYACTERSRSAVDEKILRQDQYDNYEPIVSVSSKKVADTILISVKDNGNGIPVAIKDKIFQPFFTTKPTGQGTGLGLSLSYDIVKAHGGELRVETKEKEGSEFIIQLPKL